MSINWLEEQGSREWARTRLPDITPLAINSPARKLMEEATQEIIRRIRELEVTVARNRMALSPIRLIPNEVLALIFEQWMRIPLDPEDELRRLDFLLVCRNWRKVALGHPQCWVNCSIKIKDKAEDLDNNELLRAVMNRIRMASQF